VRRMVAGKASSRSSTGSIHREDRLRPVTGSPRPCRPRPGATQYGVVLSTLRQAADLDFQLTVLADGCLDADPEVHQLLLGKVFPRQAEVTTIADWTARLNHPASSRDGQ
jgi:hypothetical protein